MQTERFYWYVRVPVTGSGELPTKAGAALLGLALVAGGCVSYDPNGLDPLTSTSLPDSSSSDETTLADSSSLGEGDTTLSLDLDVVYVPNTCYIADPEADGNEVSCDLAHTIEIYDVFFLPDDTDPALLLERATEVCSTAFLDRTGVHISFANIYSRRWIRPTPESWHLGSRDVVCYVEYPVPVDVRFEEVDPLRAFGKLSVFGLEVGGCVAEYDASVVSFDLVSCDEPHEAEVFVAQDLPDESYPGSATLEEIADELCFGEQFAAFIGVPYADSVFFALRLFPAEQTWSDGDRAISCVVVAEGKEQITGPLAGSNR
ncbi:MAG: hypothetical protein GY925_21180 [Actinomycetia bacterium]|nr:hypothetical protein [Actinomycetes bacterium]